MIKAYERHGKEIKLVPEEEARKAFREKVWSELKESENWDRFKEAWNKVSEEES